MKKVFAYLIATAIVLPCFLCIGAYAINPHDTLARQAGSGALALILLMLGIGMLFNRSRCD